MPYEEESIVAEWMDRLKDLNVSTKKMFGCYSLYAYMFISDDISYIGAGWIGMIHILRFNFKRVIIKSEVQICI